MDILFFKIWRNIYIKNEIFEHLKKFKDFQEEVTFYNKNDLLTFKDRYYITKLSYLGPEILYDNDLPENVEFLEVVNEFEKDDENPLPLISFKNPPSSLKTLQISTGSKKNMVPYPLNFFPKTITTLNLSGCENRLLEPNVITTSSITIMSFSYWYNLPFEIDSLPNGLKELNFFRYGKFNQEFKLNQLPKSLTTLKLPQGYKQPLSKELIKSLPLLETLLISNSYNSIEYDFLKSIKNLKWFNIRPLYN
ncbi:hypothetical protein RB653_006203 [Dictyostelium firmibasis]|uniref:FNIP repeat-containing protein n=1 Tax=Dictyostelium firmibasis TaxID=79012 RepID=A0AAN7U2J0_9MYCE